MLILVPLVLWLFLGSYWGVTSFLCLLWHYLHDTKPLSDGIAWLWPWDRRYWALDGTWELPEESKMAGSGLRHHDWLRQNWLQPSKRSVLEIGFGSVALGLGAGIGISLQLGFALFVLSWIGTCVVWLMSLGIKKVL